MKNEKMTWQEFMALKKESKPVGIFKALSNAKTLLFRMTSSPAPDLEFDALDVAPDVEIKKQVKK